MITEAEINALKARVTSTQALLVLLIQQMAKAGHIDIQNFASTLADGAERTISDNEGELTAAKRDLYLAAKEILALSRQITGEVEPPKFRPVIVSGHKIDPKGD